MKTVVHICDICKRDIFFNGYKCPEPIRIKIKAKRRYDHWGDDLFPWTNIELCTECADNMIEYLRKEINNGKRSSS